MSPKPWTISDIARELGLSKSAVSYALNGHAGVSESTRARVLRFAESVDWHPHASARSLSGSATGTIGIVLARPAQGIATENFFSAALGGIERCLDEVDGAALLRMTGRPGHDAEVMRRWSQTRRVDGFLLFDELVGDPRIDLVRSLGIPTVMVGGGTPLTTGRDIPRIVAPDEADAEILFDHLIHLGHREILLLSGPGHLRHEVRRVRRLQELAAARRIRLVTHETDYTAAQGRSAVRDQLTESCTISAIIAANDLVALGALEALHALDRVHDTALVSWEDSALCTVASPQVSALDRSPDTLAQQATQLLLELIAGHSYDGPRPFPSSPMRSRQTSIPIR